MGLPAFIGTALGLSLLNKSNKNKNPAQPLGGALPATPDSPGPASPPPGSNITSKESTPGTPAKSIP